MDWAQVNRTAWELLRAGELSQAVRQWNELAQGLLRGGRVEEARGIGRTLVQVTRDGVPQLELASLYCLAVAARECGELEEAERCLERARVLNEQRGDGRSLAWDLVSLGELAEDGGDLERAVDLWGRAASLMDEASAPEAVYELCLDLGRGYAALGSPVLASAWEQRAEQLSARWAQ